MELGDDRYVLLDEIAVGGTATVHLARQRGAVGFSRTVAIKRLHPHLARDASFVAMMVDEALLAARIHHPNVVAVLDTVNHDQELFLVLEYVHGESLANVLRSIGAVPVPVPIAVAILSDVLAGLHAAHEAVDDGGAPLHIVHRDISPQNVLVGADGRARILDFGVAKAVARLQTTEQGQLKGKLAYMAPEQLRGAQVDRRCDVFAASVVLWEMLTGQRLFRTADETVQIARILEGRVTPPGISAELDAVVMRGLAKDEDARYPNALAMLVDLEAAVPRASAQEVEAWVAPWVPERRIENARASARPAAEVPTQREAALAPTAEAATVVDAPTSSATRWRPFVAVAAIVVVALAAASALGVALQRGASDGDAAKHAPVTAPSADEDPSPAPASSHAVAREPLAAPDGSGRPLSSHPSRGGRAPTPRRTGPARAECTPPYAVGADGVRRWKAQCL